MSCTPSNDEQLIRNYFEALNAHDREAVFAFYAPDFVLENPDAGFRLDRSGIEPIVDWDLALHCDYTIQSLRAEPQGIRVVVRETNDLFRLLAMQPITLECVYDVEDTKLQSQSFRVLAGDADVSQELQPVVAWAEQHHPRALEEIYPGGRLVFTPEAATRWVELLQEWRESTSPE